MRFLLVILAFLPCFSFQNDCTVKTSKGHFYREITDGNDKETNRPDEPVLNAEFFECGQKVSCTNVAKSTDTDSFQIVNGEAELKNIKRPVIVWEKQGKGFFTGNLHLSPSFCTCFA